MNETPAKALHKLPQLVQGAAAGDTGDLATARNELAYLATTQNWQVARFADSVSSLLEKSFDPQQWEAAKREQLERHRRCFASGRLVLQGH